MQGSNGTLSTELDSLPNAWRKHVYHSGVHQCKNCELHVKAWLEKRRTNHQAVQVHAAVVDATVR